MFWLVFSFLTILFAYFGDEKVSGKKYAVYFRILLILTLSYVVGFGGGLFADHKQNIYQFYHFGRMQQLPINSWFDLFFGKIDYVEVGYVLFIKLIYSLNLSEVGLFFIVAFFTNTLLVSTFYRFECPALIVFIFLTSTTFIQEFNLIRQELAIAVLLFSLKYIEERNIMKYLFCISLAFWIHHSMLIGVLLLPLFIRGINNQLLLILLFIIWLFSLYASLSSVDLNLAEISLILGTQTEYDSYLNNTDFAGVGEHRTSIKLNALILFLFLFYKIDERRRVYMIFFVLLVVLGNLVTLLPNLYRIQIIFLSVYSLFIPHMCKNVCKGRIASYISFGMLMMVILYHTYQMFLYASDDNQIIGKKMVSVFDMVRSSYL